MDYNLRRDKIMDIVFARGSETVENLAQEFGVSPRTILRDISAMSIDKPIFTKVGRGGYVRKQLFSRGAHTHRPTSGKIKP